ncbi:MAG: peroxiredoxin [Woeseiaceae bacterium]
MPAPALDRVVPDFKAQATGDQTVHLKALRGSKVVLYFYPKDSTPGCTTEGQDFRDLHAKFRRENAQVFGVSRDSLASHEKFREKQKFPFQLISDPNESLCRLFDVIQEKSLYGRKFMGVERSTFLIDEKGKLRAEWRKVKVKGHAQEVLDAVKNC